MSLRFSKAVQLMHRPQLITAQAAETFARRITAIDPKAFRRPGRFAALAHKLRLGVSAEALKRPEAMEDDDYYVEPTTPACYAPLWMGEPDVQLDWGWSVKDGVAMMEIAGPLVDRGGYVGECYEWMHGYDTISAAIAQADANGAVKGMLIKFDTPGGVVGSGIYDLATELQARGPDAKPIWAVCEMACSAGYWIASQCDRVIAPAAGLVGSIGVIVAHENYAAALKGMGIEITTIEFPEGGFKSDGAWWKALSPEGQAALQSDINELGAAFLSTVEKGRAGKINAAQAKALGAQVFPAVHSDKARDAKALGLIDDVMSEREAFEALRAEVSAASFTQVPAPAGSTAAPAASKPAKAGATTETSMNRDQRIAAVMAGKTSAKTESEKLEAIQAILDEPTTGAEGEGGGEGEPAANEDEEIPAATGDEETDKEAKASKSRIKAILALPEAKGRNAQAQHIALETDLTVEQAKGVLASSPKATGFVATDPGLSDAGGPKPTELQKDLGPAFANAGVPMRKRHG